MIDFKEKYKAYTNLQLLYILNNSDDYQPEAVEAAKEIISGRQLSPDEIAMLKEELETEAEANRAASENSPLNRAINAGRSASQLFVGTPETAANASERRLWIIALLPVSIIFIITFFFDSSLLLFLFSEDSGSWEFYDILFIHWLITYPLTFYLLFKKKNWGWKLAVFLLSGSVSGNIGAIIFSLLHQNDPPSPLDVFLAIPAPETYILPLVFFGFSLAVYAHKKIRAIFAAPLNQFWLIFGISFGLQMLLYLI
ncbi:MAG: hypothetical protein ACK5Z2_10125 [Bacteroidota bacterium]|jgi:hypothetical protein